MSTNKKLRYMIYLLTFIKKKYSTLIDKVIVFLNNTQKSIINYSQQNYVYTIEKKK